MVLKGLAALAAGLHGGFGGGLFDRPGLCLVLACARGQCRGFVGAQPGGFPYVGDRAPWLGVRVGSSVLTGLCWCAVWC